MVRAAHSDSIPSSEILILDCDPASRNSLAELFASVGLKSKLFSSPAELFRAGRPEVSSCLVMEFRLPLMGGLDVQLYLRQLEIHIPVIMLSAQADVLLAVRAMKAGAVDFLTKPTREQDLLDAVHIALERDSHHREKLAARADLERLYKGLTTREREVMHHVTTGLMNKQIAYQLGLSEITVKVHRGSVMRKMNARSLAELVCMSRTLSGADMRGRTRSEYLQTFSASDVGALISAEPGRSLDNRDHAHLNGGPPRLERSYPARA